MASKDGFVIVPPISPWDEKHRDEIELDNAMRTFGTTEAEAWAIHVRAGKDSCDRLEVSRRIQHWHDRGYRVRKATLTVHPAPCVTARDKGERLEHLTREDIRAIAACSTCGAWPGDACTYEGKGAEKAMRLGKNHQARMEAAQRANNARAKPDDFSVIE